MQRVLATDDVDKNIIGEVKGIVKDTLIGQPTQFTSVAKLLAFIKARLMADKNVGNSKIKKILIRELKMRPIKPKQESSVSRG